MREPPARWSTHIRRNMLFLTKMLKGCASTSCAWRGGRGWTPSRTPPEHAASRKSPRTITGEPLQPTVSMGARQGFRRAGRLGILSGPCHRRKLRWSSRCSPRACDTTSPWRTSIYPDEHRTGVRRPGSRQRSSLSGGRGRRRARDGKRTADDGYPGSAAAVRAGVRAGRSRGVSSAGTKVTPRRP